MNVDVRRRAYDKIRLHSLALFTSSTFNQILPLHARLWVQTNCGPAMATFAKTTFNAAKYAISRPTYPRELYESVLTYHEHSLGLSGASARWSHALDLGCGTGASPTAAARLPNNSSQDRRQRKS